jgi:uncharacterized protein YidB (DUF937 family)
MPSMLALLGLLAVAGYQNRDKLSEMLKGAGGAGEIDPATGKPKPGLGGVLGDLGDLFGGSTAGKTIQGGIGDLIDRFKQTGQGEKADSWVTTGPNRGLSADQVEQAVGADNLAELSRRTGLSREELLQRLSANIPDAIDKFTPNGRIPTEDEASGFVGNNRSV